jgi:hypothetical protein
MSTDLDVTRPDTQGLVILNPHGGRDARDDYEDALATISAGYRAGDGNASRPQASRDGTIYLHDPDKRAPGLADALKATSGKALTVAFLADDPAKIVQQRFMSYSATRLVAYGDERRITWIKWRDEQDEKAGFDRVVFEAGTDEYERARAKMKVYASVYFALAHYDDGGEPEVLFPDGLGFYRLRTTSLNSLRALKSSLENVRRLTGGRLRGIPFELSIGYREVARPNGRKTKIPVWQAILRPPEGIVLGSRTFARLAQAGLQQGRMLALPPATDELLAAEAADALEADFAEVAEPTEAEAELVGKGGRCDAEYWTTRWHATAANSRYESDEERHRLIFAITRGRYASLATFLSEATEEEAAQLVLTLGQAKAADEAEPQAIPVRSVNGDADEADWPQEAEWHDAADEAESEPVADEAFGMHGEPRQDATPPSPGVEIAERSGLRPTRGPSDDENLAGMARKAVRAFVETFRKEDGDKPISMGLKRAYGKLVGQDLACGEEALVSVLPRLVGKADPSELTAAEMRAVMSWAGGPDAPDQVAAMLRLQAAEAQ